MRASIGSGGQAPLGIESSNAIDNVLALSFVSEWSNDAASVHEGGGRTAVSGVDISDGGSGFHVGPSARAGGDSTGPGLRPEGAGASLCSGSGETPVMRVREAAERGPQGRECSSSSSASESVFQCNLWAIACFLDALSAISWQ